MKQIVSLLILVFLSGFSLKGQNVKIGEGSLLRGRGLCEPSISINPANPANMVAGAVLDQVFYSLDSGKTWTGDTLVSSFGVWGDPVVVSDTAGAHYFLHLSDPNGDNWSGDQILDRIVIQKSVDGGKSWNNGSYTGMFHPKDQDKHWAVVDPKTNAIYITWTQFDKYGTSDKNYESNILFSKSLDGGETWSEAIRINQIPGNCVDGDSTTEGAVPAVGADGTIYVTWANQEKLFFDKSTDGGETWLEEDKVIAEQPGGWDIDVEGIQRANGMPVTICDLSEGPHRGDLYVNWVDDRSGNYDVWFSKSEDGGETWSDPSRINDDEGDRKISEKPFRSNPMVFFGDYNHISAVNGVVRPIWTRIDDLVMGVWTHLYQEAK